LTLDITNYVQSDENEWERFCLKAENSTFLHTRKFLGYHGSRFRDVSVLIYKKNGNLVAVMPAAVDPFDADTVVSHPGATYGGIIHQGWMSGVRMVEAFASLKNHYASMGFKKLVYKAIPYIYSLAPAQDDLYALFRHDAVRVRCDLSCTIDLFHRRKPSERRQRNLRKAQRSVQISSDPSFVGPLWKVIADNLSREHRTTPVHTIDELKYLANLFPDTIKIQCGIVEKEVEAGIVFFNSPSVWHAQYIASSEKGYLLSALDAVFNSAIDMAQMAGVRYFDFGISNENSGRILNDGLYHYKSEFGGSGVVHEFYEMELA
jgi:hypothetical protein